MLVLILIAVLELLFIWTYTVLKTFPEYFKARYTLNKATEGNIKAKIKKDIVRKRLVRF